MGVGEGRTGNAYAIPTKEIGYQTSRPLFAIQESVNTFIQYAKDRPDTGLAGVEMSAEVVIKATKVDGVYTDDPKTHPDAMRYKRLTFDEAIVKNLKVMDATALTLCRDQKLPVSVFSIFKPGALKRVILGEDEGTLVHN